MASFITVDRKILKWEWYQDVKVFHLFLYFLLRANWEDGRWKGIEVKRGQLITGRIQLSKDTGLSEREIRTCQEKLKTTGEVTIKTTSKYSIITICKYDVYQKKYDKVDQQNDQHLDQQTTSKRPANDQQTTTNNTLNNNKEEKTEGIKGFNTMPLPFHFNGLSETKIGSTIELVRLTKYATLTTSQVSDFWEAFKIQNLTGKKFYADEDEVYSHFLNWIKKQDFKNGTHIKSATKSSKSAGAEQLLADIKSQVAAGRTKDT